MKKLISSVVILGIFIIMGFAFGKAPMASYATLKTGPEVNSIIKSLAAGYDVSLTGADTLIVSIQKADNIPENIDDYRHADVEDSDYSYMAHIVMRYDNGVIYYYTNAFGGYIRMNPNSEGLFRGLRSLESVDLNKITTHNVTSMRQMFYDCRSLQELDLSNFDTSSVTTMEGMFNGCKVLSEIDVSSFDTSNVTTMKTMFYDCRSVDQLDVSSFDTSNVTNMASMFANNSNNTELTTIYASDGFTTSGVTVANNHKNMFGKATKLVGGNGTTFDSTKTNKEYARIDGINGLSGYFTEKVTPIEDSILLPGTGLNKLIKDLVNDSTHTYSTNDNEIKSIKRMNELESTDYVTGSIKGVVNPVYFWYDNVDRTIFYYSESDTIYLNPDSSYMFSNLRVLEEVEFSGIDTSRVTTMEGMFNACQSLTELNLSNFNTENVTNMHAMFNACHNLKEVDVSNFDTKNVTDMKSMFSECQQLEEIDVSNFNTESVTDMHAMFNACRKLKSLDISNFDTSNVKTMETMFYDCRELKELDLSNFDTNNVTNMRKMFDGVTVNNSNKLKSLDVSSFDTSNADMEGIFDHLPNLTTIYASDSFIVKDGITITSMFSDDVSLVGGNGTKFSDLEVIDKTYALVDSETQSGYFTDANNITVKFIKIDGTDQILQKKQIVSKGGTVTALTDEEIGETWTGHGLRYYVDSGMTTEFDFSQPIMKYTEIYTQREINQYTITFVKGNGEPDEVITDDYGTGITAPADPTREGYTFKGWDKPVPPTMPAENVTITAKWEEEKQSGGGNSGGYSGGGGHSHDNSDHGSAGDEQKENNTQEQETTPTDNQKNEAETQGKDNTQNATHEWSYKNGLTKYINASDARLGDSLTRSEMAKLSSIFATKVLGETPDESKQSFCSQFADISKLNGEMRDYVIKACELGYMGYQSNGVDELVNFRPYSPVTVAEASVIVSRMMWGNQNASSGKNWYKGHLYAAYNHGLLDDIRNPYRNITRGEAFEMFYRTSQAK